MALNNKNILPNQWFKKLLLCSVGQLLFGRKFIRTGLLEFQKYRGVAVPELLIRGYWEIKSEGWQDYDFWIEDSWKGGNRRD